MKYGHVTGTKRERQSAHDWCACRGFGEGKKGERAPLRAMTVYAAVARTV